MPAVRRVAVAALRLALVLAAAGCAPTRPPATAPSAARVPVQLLAINDLHGNLEPPPGSNGRIDATDAGGAAYLATHVRQAIACQPNTVVVAAGDLVGASPLVSSIFHDEPTIEALNAMSLAVSAIGNHEFDEGVDELLRLKRGGCHPVDGCRDGDGFEGAAFDYLSANVMRRSDGSLPFSSVAIRTVGGIKIGFIGITTVETARIVPPTVTKAVEFTDEAEAANRAAADLVRQGIRAIVLLIHEGLRQGGDAPEPNGCVAPAGGLDRVLSRLSPDIQVVISGHSHAFYNCRIGGRLVTSASSFGRMFTRVNLEIDPATDRIVSAEAGNEIVTRDVAADPTVLAIVGKYSTHVAEVANQKVGSVTGDLRAAPNDAGESVLGNVIADAQLAATRAADRGGAVVAFMNRGGIRGDIVAGPEASAAQPRAVTYRELHNIQPFGNIVMTATMTGEMIHQLLEQQFDNPTPGARKILQVSEGFTYRYRAGAEPGRRIDPGSIRINGQPLAPSDRLRIAASDFLLNGGDGFSVFTEATDRQAALEDIAALVDYFKANSPVGPPSRNRIISTN
jgi:5'-nucleotidase